MDDTADPTATRRPCICGSSKEASACCHVGGRWHKPSATLRLSEPETGYGADACYMRQFGACDGKVTGEHLVSETILRLIARDEIFRVGGLPWIEPDEFRSVGFKSLKAKCLCKYHNSALSPLDTAARYFFDWFRSALECAAGAKKAMMSGHDLERWLLKTLKAMAVSGNLHFGKDDLIETFHPDVDVLRLLEDVSAWPEDGGLFCVNDPAEEAANFNRFSMAPLTTPDNEIYGLYAELFGQSFVLMLVAYDDLKFPQNMGPPIRRPCQFEVFHGEEKHTMLVSWDQPPKSPVGLQFRWRGPIATTAQSTRE
jgi:hypothetical protein